MTIGEALRRAIVRLRTARLTEAHLDAEMLLAHVLGTTRGYLLANTERALTGHQAARFSQLIAKRLRRHPIAYLTGHQEFYGLDFFVNKNVLIPRPDTETLVEAALAAARHLIATDPTHQLTIADIGTGSGCIAVVLAKYLPSAKIIATDISPAALAIAKQNAKAHRVTSRLFLRRGNVLAPLKRFGKIDLFVANLPYLTRDELRNVQKEPRLALHGGKMGLELIERLLASAPPLLAKTGAILLEISPTQVGAVVFLVGRYLPDKQFTLLKDLTGRHRVAKIF